MNRDSSRERWFKCAVCENVSQEKRCPECGEEDYYELEEIKRTYNVAYVNRCFDDSKW